MRKVHTLGVSLFGAVIAIACGGSSVSNNPPGNDAGNNGPDASNVTGDDASVSSEDGAAGDDSALACVIDADLTTAHPPDASIGGDSGASVGTCLACAQTNCGADITACNTDCACNQGFTCVYTCLGGVGNSLLSCGGQCFGSLANIDTAEKALLGCAVSKCKNECNLGGLGGGGGKDSGGSEAGGDASDDGATDSATDGAGE